uniref:Si:ch73-234b20.5 n=1 Tax=Xiphophorus couchianus TaxID=32473 RepID=A0A3B5MH17_9TELE
MIHGEVKDTTNPQPADAASSGTFDQVQSQVNEVKVILKDNINKVLERGDKIDDLIGKTDDLQASADSFQRTSTRVARKYWWKNIKMMILIGAIVLIILILIILAACKVI